MIKIWSSSVTLLLLLALMSCNPNNLEDPSTFYVLEDSTGTVTAEIAWAYFQEGKYTLQKTRSFNPGFTKSYYWLLIKTPAENNTPLMLEMGTPHINALAFYPIRNGKPELGFITGDHFPFHQRPLATTNFVFPLRNEDNYYLARIDKVSEALQVNFRTDREEVIDKDLRDRYFIMGSLTGLLLLMCFFAVFLFAISRERIYLFYLFYILAGWLYVLSNTGFAYQYLWPDSTWMAERSRPILALLTLGFSFHFVEAFSGRIRLRWVRNILLVTTGLAYLCILIIVLGYGLSADSSIGYYFQMAVPIMIGISLLTILTALIDQIAAGNRMAAFFLASFLPLIFFGLLQLSYYAGGIDLAFSYLRRYGQPTGYIFEAIILTFGLAYRFNTYRIEKEQLLREANRQQAAYAKAIITTQEQERRQLADQLHDVAGSLLSSARLNLSSVREKHLVIDEDGRLKLQRAEEAVTDISEMLRDLSHAISPVMMDKVGFRQSVEKIVGIFNGTGKIKVELEVLGFEANIERWHNHLRLLYGILYELMNNVVKHAGANHVLIQVVEHDDSFVMVVEDDGVGLSDAKSLTSNTHGLSAIQSKVHYFHGTVVFDRAVPHGLIVAIEIPKDDQDKNSPR